MGLCWWLVALRGLRAIGKGLVEEKVGESIHSSMRASLSLFLDKGQPTGKKGFQVTMMIMNKKHDLRYICIQWMDLKFRELI